MLYFQNSRGELSFSRIVVWGKIGIGLVRASPFYTRPISTMSRAMSANACVRYRARVYTRTSGTPSNNGGGGEAVQSCLMSRSAGAYGDEIDGRRSSERTRLSSTRGRRENTRGAVTFANYCNLRENRRGTADVASERNFERSCAGRRVRSNLWCREKSAFESDRSG